MKTAKHYSKCLSLSVKTGVGAYKADAEMMVELTKAKKLQQQCWLWRYLRNNEAAAALAEG